MKLAIMQPYFFPYIGYFQLIRAVEKFVFYDDVNYIKSGWINRNRLYIADAIRYITMPLSNASSFEKINNIKIRPATEWSTGLLTAVAQNYKKAPFYKPVYNLVREVLSNPSNNLSTVASNSVTTTAEYIGLSTNFVPSSSVYENQDKKSADRVLDICRLEHATEYWNLPGGRDLYSVDQFLEQGIELKFVDVSIAQYKQAATQFQPGLSIIDVLMYNEPAQVLAMLETQAQP